LKANTVKLPEIFGAHTRYRVPLFQRPYVWQKDKQWQPLWDDLRELAERQTDANPANDEIAHFMGAIVVDQEISAEGPNSRLLIDGQQRLTTLQLVLAAARVHAIDHADEQTVAKLEALLFLPSFLLRDPADRLILIPTNYDRNAFAAAIEADGQPTSALAKTDSTHILTAYAFFRGAIAEWLSEESDDTPGEKLRALANAMWDLLRIVVIALEHGDDAQAIFETLNARGTPLLAADLVKNYLFRAIELGSGSRAADQAYKEYWSRFDQRQWREEIAQGRTRRPRIDVLLTYWLVLQTQDEINFQAVFEGFARYAKGRNPTELLASLDATAAIFEGWDGLDPFGPEGTFFHRLNVMEAGTFMPVALFVYGPSGISDKGSREMALSAIESWLVRRMICRMTTKNYNSVAIALLRDLSKRPNPSGHDVVMFLDRLEGESQRWPSDGEVREAVRTLPFYTSLTRRRLRMILDAIEASLHDAKVGPFADRDRLTIEHVLPQAWDPYWPLSPNGDPLQNRIERDTAKHRLGNLALVTQSLNSNVGNAPWVTEAGSSKRDGLRRYSQYMINKDVIDEEEWGEAQIAARGEKFARIVLSIWPSASSIDGGDHPSEVVDSPRYESNDHRVSPPSPDLPEGVVQTLAHYPPFTRHLAIQLAERARRFDGVSIREQKSKNTPWYYQLRHPRYRQVVAYVNLGDDLLRIDYRLPNDHQTDLDVIRRENFYGIRFVVHSVDQLDSAERLLRETLARPV
jgi:hypothetical protein